jgi:CheY-like chemotaxis protein
MVRKSHVLVVDDDPDVRQFTVTLLADAGFDVREAPDAPAALSLLANGETIDVLLTDIKMPGMTGLELARRAREQSPDLRVLFMSGYAAEYRIDPKRDDFIGKPFRPVELVGCVWEILNRKRG